MYKHRKLSFPRRSWGVPLLSIIFLPYSEQERNPIVNGGSNGVSTSRLMGHNWRVAHGRLKCDDVRPIVSRKVSSRLVSAPVSPTYVMFVDFN